MKKRILSGLTAFMICAIMVVAPLSMPTYALTTGPDVSAWPTWVGLADDVSSSVGDYLSSVPWEDLGNPSKVLLNSLNSPALSNLKKYYSEFNEDTFSRLANDGITQHRGGSFGSGRAGSFGGSNRRGSSSLVEEQDEEYGMNLYDYSTNQFIFAPITNISVSYNFEFTSVNNYVSTTVYNSTVHIGDVITNVYIIETPNCASYAYDIGESSYFVDIYYQLPDGRNSIDLTADEIWGTYFIYDAINYDFSVEDDGSTLGLWHFDGNVADSSYYGNDISFKSNASYAFVDSLFNQSLKLEQGSTFTADVDYDLTQDYTIEGRLQLIPNTVTPTNFGFNGSFKFKNNIYKFGGSNQIGDYSSVNPDDVKAYVNETYGSGVWSYLPMEIGDSYKQHVYRCVLNSPILCYSSSALGVTDFLGFSLPLFNNVQSFLSPYVRAIIFSYIDNAKFPFTNSTSSSLSFEFDVQAVSGGEKLEEPIVISIPEEYIYFSYVFKDGAGRYYLNGVDVFGFDLPNIFKKVNSVTSTTYEFNFSTGNDEYYLDELRLSNKALYTSNYVPRQQPFDTNLVFTLPESADETNIAVKSNVVVNDLRVGGVRPTYAENGDVYIYLDNDVVKSVQQYQSNGWYDVDAVIYADNDWQNIYNYSLDTYLIDDEDYPTDDIPDDTVTPTPSPAPDDTTDTDGDGIPDVDDSDDDSDGILNNLVSTITNFIGNLFDSVFGGILDLVNILIDNLNSLLDSFTGITGLIGSLFGFFPDEIITVLTIGLSAIFILAIIKMFKG